MSHTSTPRLYLAGPDVFLPDARTIGAVKKRICAEAGLAGVFPLDAVVDLDGQAPAEKARRIYAACVELMQGCDAALVNMTPFRGVSIDSGTAFEAGYMRALGRPVFGYTNAGEDFRVRSETYRRSPTSLPDFDGPDVSIEDFGLVENLMIAIAVTETGAPVAQVDTPPAAVATGLDAFRAAVRHAARYFAHGGHR